MDGKEKNVFYVLTDGWFSLLEKVILLGAVKYIAERNHNLILKTIYYISFFFLQSYLQEIFYDANYAFLPKKYQVYQKKFNILIGSLIGLFVSILIFTLLNYVTKP